MKLTSLSIIVFVEIARFCNSEIVLKTPEPTYRRHLYEAAIDLLMTCYGDPGNAVGVLGDRNGLILKTLRSNYLIPTVLLEGSELRNVIQPGNKQHKLQNFIIAADSEKTFVSLLYSLENSVWMNINGNFLLLETSDDPQDPSTPVCVYMYIANFFGLLNVQVIQQIRHTPRIVIYSSNPFTQQAPQVWRLLMDFHINDNERPINLFDRLYQKGGKSCRDLNFAKTIDVGGYPIYFYTTVPDYIYYDLDARQPSRDEPTDHAKKVMASAFRKDVWFIRNIIIALNASAVKTSDFHRQQTTISMRATLFSDKTAITQHFTDRLILPLTKETLIAMTQHTSHKSQLNKILTVIDEKSQIGMGITYLITFFFFKFFVDDALIPALLNIVRLTCNMGLVKLPTNLGATIYLACLFMFVVTLQAIFTGNLATLLTTTIAYPNVEKKEDIPRLGYTAYAHEEVAPKLSGDPVLAGHVIEIPYNASCYEYILSDPMAACVIDRAVAIIRALKFNLHLSRHTIADEYVYHITSQHFLLRSRVETIMKGWIENGIPREDEIFKKVQLDNVDDEMVKQNVERRVMSLTDLRFAFVILGIGLTLSSICFIGELIIYRIIHSKRAKQRDRFRARLGITEKKFSLFRSLNLRIRAIRLFSKRR